MAYHNRFLNSQMLPIGAMLLSIGASSVLADSADSNATIKAIDIQDTVEIELPRYQPGISKTAKTGQLAHDVPQAITVVTKELLHDKSEFTLKEALSNVSGLTFNAAEGGRIGDNMNLRGFYTFGDLYLDGIRDVAQYNRDTFNLEQVDVLRGGAAMLFGRGQAGGVINQVSKDAEAENFGKLSMTLGTDEYKRASTDINVMLNDTTAFRLNAMGMDAGSTRNDVYNESYGIAPTITFGLGTDNEFSLSHLYLNTHITPDYGVPFDSATKRPIDVDKSTFYGFTDDFEDNRVNITTASYTHKFSKETQLRSVIRHADYLRDNWAIAPGGYDPVTGSVNRSSKGNGAKEKTDTWQNDFTTKFEALGMKHEALVGTEFLREEQVRWGHDGLSSYFPNISDANGPANGLPDTATGRHVASNGIIYSRTSATGSWVAQLPNSLESGSSIPEAYKAVYGNKERNINGGYKGHTWALYAQDVVEFVPNWKVMAGFRKDWLKMDYYTGASLTQNGDLRYNEMSYRAGLSYQPSSRQHYYLAWNNSFNTTGDLYSFSNRYDPERSVTYELGAKWELFEGDLSLRTAVYRTIKEWERNTDVMSASSNPILSKERHTDGIELEAAGRITDNWDVFAGLALMDPEVDAVAPGKSDIVVGQKPPNSTDYTFNVWTTYKLGGGWKVGGGIEGKGDRAVYSYPNSGATSFNPNVAPHYVRYDAMIGYTQKNYAVQLNVKNLFDTTYYESAYINGGFAVPGTGRTAQVTLDYKFF
ncbi:TonB-dependent siderophore receptor [Sulfuricurvum sp. IAE1]|uniref:TonB-dependent receptor n=1 Tax=Sulfuricurvum sp. IAE1 TaxID=2546102 RepID=UPI00105341CB|nr:TonB-dependent receptor [Sulfuricurvum sp. IAE1]TDA69110.1 TonB-dependent siderophore receptor [Sulfuricurvum sp. IAE1]